jgi:hypothetical protein
MKSIELIAIDPHSNKVKNAKNLLNVLIVQGTKVQYERENHRRDKTPPYGLLRQVCGTIVISTHKNCRESDSELQSAWQWFELREL